MSGDSSEFASSFNRNSTIFRSKMFPDSAWSAANGCSLSGLKHLLVQNSSHQRAETSFVTYSGITTLPPKKDLWKAMLKITDFFLRK